MLSEKWADARALEHGTTVEFELYSKYGGKPLENFEQKMT